MKHIMQTILIGVCVVGILMPFYHVTQAIVPIEVLKQQNTIERNLHSLGAPPKYIRPISSAIHMASQQTGVKHQFITALMYTESTYNPNAKSPLNYYGLMQIPWKIKYIDANVLIGVHIYQEKLIEAKGDIRKAISLYKGFGKRIKDGYPFADKVIRIYKQLG